jgi:beta-phosphoglucomutase-like phosphatase (HAD superfamily)
MIRNINDLPNGQTLLADFSFLTHLSIDTDFNILTQLKNYAISYFKNNFNDNLVIKNCIELFNHFHKLGLKQSIISNSNQELCDFSTNRIGIKDKCVHCFGIESVDHGKPAPELYLQALKAHKIIKSECLVFEDSFTGIEAAKNAKLTVISVGLDAMNANPNHIWNIKLESSLTIFNRLSKSYKFIKPS